MADFPLEDEAIQKCLGLSEDKSTDEKLGNIHCKSKCCANYERFATILNFQPFERAKLKWGQVNAAFYFCRRAGHNFLKACANSDLQTVNAQDTPMPPPRKWMMPVALSMVMLSALGWKGAVWPTFYALCLFNPRTAILHGISSLCREKSKNPKTPCNAVNAVCLLCPQSWEPTPIDKPREQQRQLAVEKSKPEPETFSNAKQSVCLVNPSNMSWPPKASASTTATVNPKSRHRQRCKVCDIKMVWEFIVPKECLTSWVI